MPWVLVWLFEIKWWLMRGTSPLLFSLSFGVVVSAAANAKGALDRQTHAIYGDGKEFGHCSGALTQDG